MNQVTEGFDSRVAGVKSNQKRLAAKTFDDDYGYCIGRINP